MQVREIRWKFPRDYRDPYYGDPVVSGTVRDSLHMVDVIFGLDGG